MLFLQNLDLFGKGYNAQAEDVSAVEEGGLKGGSFGDYASIEVAEGKKLTVKWERVDKPVMDTFTPKDLKWEGKDVKAEDDIFAGKLKFTLDETGRLVV